MIGLLLLKFLSEFLLSYCWQLGESFYMSNTSYLIYLSIFWGFLNFSYLIVVVMNEVTTMHCIWKNQEIFLMYVHDIVLIIPSFSMSCH
jgi:hypothetical protein